MTSRTSFWGGGEGRREVGYEMGSGTDGCGKEGENKYIPIFLSV